MYLYPKFILKPTTTKDFGVGIDRVFSGGLHGLNLAINSVKKGYDHESLDGLELEFVMDPTFTDF